MSDAAPSQPGPPPPVTRGDDGLGFACPRCARAVTERFYGPCRSCRAELVAAQTGTGRDVEAGRFEPRMHVTPNAVATRD